MQRTAQRAVRKTGGRRPYDPAVVHLRIVVPSYQSDSRVSAAATAAENAARRHRSDPVALPGSESDAF